MAARKKTARDVDVERVRGATRRLLANPSATPEVQLLAAWLLWDVANSPIAAESAANSNLLGELKLGTPGYAKKGGSVGEKRPREHPAERGEQYTGDTREVEPGPLAETVEGSEADGADAAP